MSDIGFGPYGPISDGGGGIPSITPGTPITIVPPTPPAGATPSPTTPSTKPSNVTSVKSPTDGTVQPGGPLWMRKWALTIGAPAGDKALDLSLLDFEFEVKQALNQPPWTALIKVWNPNQEITGGLAKKELTQVLLQAGYQSPSQQYGNVFSGQINYYKAGKQNATDTFVELHCSTFDTAINATVVNTWLPAGHQVEDQIKAVLSAMAPWGVVLGQLPDDLDKAKSPRGRTMFGMAHDILRDIERTQGGHFFIDQTGKLHLLRDGEALKMGSQKVPILNSHTGLIDVPTETLGSGVEAQCLLNPAIQPGTLVNIDVKSTARLVDVNTAAFPDTALRLSNTAYAFHTDGTYVVYTVRHHGQNRGNPWYTQILTAPAVQNAGLGQSV